MIYHKIPTLTHLYTRAGANRSECVWFGQRNSRKSCTNRPRASSEIDNCWPSLYAFSTVACGSVAVSRQRPRAHSSVVAGCQCTCGGIVIRRHSWSGVHRTSTPRPQCLRCATAVTTSPFACISAQYVRTSSDWYNMTNNNYKDVANR